MLMISRNVHTRANNATLQVSMAVNARLLPNDSVADDGTLSDPSACSDTAILDQNTLANPCRGMDDISFHQLLMSG